MPNDLTAAVERLKALEQTAKAASVRLANVAARYPFSIEHRKAEDEAFSARQTYESAAINLLPALLAAYEEQGRELERLRMENLRLMAELAGQPPPPVEVVTTTGICPDVQELREQG